MRSRNMRWYLLVTAMVALGTAVLPAQNNLKQLQVKATYNGGEKVDQSHGIHLYIFDTPAISEGSMPIGFASTYENGGTTVFQGITVPTVYLVAAFGSYDPLSGPPPTGTPVTMYKPGDPMVPTAIHLEDEKTEIELEFDDSFRMP